jgi:hypothetical protein
VTAEQKEGGAENGFSQQDRVCGTGTPPPDCFPMSIGAGLAGDPVWTGAGFIEKDR